jgi:biopolymer transport protein ExbD
MLASWRRKPARLTMKTNGNSFALVMVVVAFVLLTIGMTLPQPSGHRSSIDLPKVTWPTSLPHAMREDAMSVVINRSGDVFFGRDRISPDQLAGLIRKGVDRGAERKVYIRADARSYYYTVKQVVDAVHEAGLVDVSFLADQRRSQPRR